MVMGPKARAKGDDGWPRRAPPAPQTATAGAFGAGEASDEITVWGQLPSLGGSHRALRTCSTSASIDLWGRQPPGREGQSPSSLDTPGQRQIKLRAASSLGQPRPIGRYVPAGRPHRPCSPHSNGPLLDFIERRAARLARRRPLRPGRPCRPCWCARLRAGAPLGSLPVRGLSQLLALHHGQLRLPLRRPLLRLARARVSGG